MPFNQRTRANFKVELIASPSIYKRCHCSASAFLQEMHMATPQLDLEIFVCVVGSRKMDSNSLGPQ